MKPRSLTAVRATACLLVGCVALGARAELAPVGPLVSISPPAGVAPVRWPAIGYDEGTDTFLAVSGATNIQGQFLGGDGTPRGSAFVVDSDTVYDQAPRAAFSGHAGAWLVTWHASISNTAAQVRGRLIRATQPPLTADFPISPPGSNWEMGAATAWSSHANAFLVAWQVFATTQINAQLVTEAGSLSGPVIAIDGTAGYERDPSVEYDPDDDVFLVAYMACPANTTCFTRAQRVASSGALIGAPLTLDGPFTGGYIPEIAYNATNRNFLVVWYRVAGGVAAMFGRTVGADGSLGAMSTVSTKYVAYDANSLAWNSISNTFVMVTHATEQDTAIELDASGVPLNTPGILIGQAGANGNFNPRIAARKGAPEWLAVTSTAFTTLSVQRLSSVQTTPPDAGPPPDAGQTVDAGSSADAGASDSGGADSGSSDSGGSTSADAGTPEDAGSGIQMGNAGCGCGTAPGSQLVILLALIAGCLRLLSSRIPLRDGAGARRRG